jgi:tRNA U34 5-carboxymethylaminomethyl modifying GTPase MnmE/TrmE
MVSKLESGDYNFTIRKLFDIVNKLNGHVSVRIDFSDDNSDLDASEEEQVAIWENVNSQNIERMERSA